ncbi:MAG: VCBS repeat-containing protein [Candidatus Hydrogenedentes bacterium]|nr:VCBS repeat-containing protein [Candidatus Hydrogenedentota bacterium]
MSAIYVAVLCFAAALPGPETVWEFTLGGEISASPVLYPTAGKPECVLLQNSAGRLVLLDGKAQIVWEHDLGAQSLTTPAVADLDGDGSFEIIASTEPGEVVLLDAQGTEHWRYRLHGKVRDWRTPTAVDLDGDGNLEILMGDEAGWLTCLTKDGRRLWRTTIDGYRVPPVATADVTGDGRPEIVYGTENDRVVCLDADGRIVWLSVHEGQFGRTSPTLGDIDGDGRYEAVLQTSFNTVRPRLIALNAEDGSLAWESPLTLQGYAAISIADLEGDGTNEVFVADRSNTIYCFNGDGSRRWATTTGGHSFMWPPAVADLDGDGRCEVIAGVRDQNEDGKSWFVLDDAGTLLGAWPIPGGMNAAALVADVDHDGRLDVVLTGSDAGIVRCVTFGGKADGARAPWVSPRYDSARTGVVPITNPAAAIPVRPAPAPVGAALPQPAVWGENVLKVEWAAPPAEGSLAEIETVDPAGRRTIRLRPLSAMASADAVPVLLAGEGEHHVAVRLWESDAPAPAAAYAGTMSIGGLESLQSSVDATLAGLEKAGESLAAGNAQLVFERKAHQAAFFGALTKRAATTAFDDARAVDDLLDAVVDFRRGLAAELRLAEIAMSARTVRPDMPLVAWEDGNPWDFLSPFDEKVTVTESPEVQVWLLGGEYESRAVHLLNLSPEPLTVQLRPDAAAQSAVQFYEVISVPRKDGMWVPDALSGISQARTIHLAPGEARSVWLTICSNELKPGVTGLGVQLLPIGREDGRLSLVLKTDVSPLSLRDAPVFRVCNWSSPERSAKGGVDRARVMADALAHGVNVFTVGPPRREANAQGELTGQAEWAPFDEDLDLMGPASFILLGGNGVRMPDGVPRFGPVHVQAQRAWLNELDGHLKSKGWEGRWALYPVDEPGLYGGTRIQMLREIATHFREAKPDIPIYANPSGGVTTTNFADLLDDISYWCPEQQLLRRKPELAKYFLDTGKPVWSYEAPGDVKSLYPLGYYRANAWMAVQLGLSGCGFWVQRYEASNDLWLTQDASEWGANYGVPGGEVISRRWEAWRDGSEDARLFLMLRRLADTARAENRHADLVQRAEQLLETDMPKVTKNAWVTNDITRNLRDYDMDFAEVQRIRQEAVQLVIGLRE